MESGFYYFKTSDGLSIRYCMCRPGRTDAAGSAVVLCGRSEFIEKYRETISDLTGRGFYVWMADWRGQGGSDRLLDNPHKGHVGSFDDYVSDLAHFMAHIVFPGAPRPLVIVAHSMGALIALRYLHVHHQAIDRAVLISPMVDIHLYPVPRGIMRAAARLAAWMGCRASYAAGGGDYDPGARTFENNRLTGDPDRYFDTVVKLTENPDLAVGGLTYGWLGAAFRSIDILAAPGYVERITTPVLIASSADERVVSRTAQKKLCSRLQDCRFVDIMHAKHELLRERDPVRAQFWKAFDGFVLKLNHLNSKEKIQPTGVIMEKETDQDYAYEDESPPSLLSDTGGWWQNAPKKPILLGGAGALLVVLLLVMVFSRGGDRPADRQVQLPEYDVMERMQGRFERLEERIEAMEMELTRLPALVHQVESMEAGGDAGKLDQLAARIDRLDENIRKIGEQARSLEDAHRSLARKVDQTRVAAAPERRDVSRDASGDSSGADDRYHVVRQGDTLFSIARNNGIPLDKLLDKNNLTEDSVIRPGDRLELGR